MKFKFWFPCAVVAVWVASCAAPRHATERTDPTAATVPPSFHFTVTSDLHNRTNIFGRVLDAMQANSGGEGAFQVSVGDVVDSASQTPEGMRNAIDRHFGSNAIWYPIVGNHDKGVVSMNWRRAEYDTGNGKRAPLKNLVAHAGPAGTAETTYSWDHGNAHFVALNEYWDSETKPGSDRATDGDIEPALCRWLDEDLAANTKPFVFVFGHEPAFPQHRHVGDSLDKYAKDRDAFWAVLKRRHVQAFISGHIHFYYKEWREGIWQIVDGTAGKDTENHQTYLDVVVGQAEAQVKVWQNDAEGSAVWHLADTIPLQAVAKP